VLFATRRLDAARIYLLFVGADGLIRSLMFTVLSVYFVTLVGMDPLQLVLVGTVVEATIVACEVPTGVLADVYSRRLSIVVGQILFGLAYIIQGTVPLFVPILLAEVVRGVGETCLSGARQAWIADEVGTERVADIFLRGMQVRRWAWLIGIAASIGLANVDLRLPIVLGGALSLLLAGFLILCMPERGFKAQPRHGRVAFFATARAGINEVRGQPILLLLLGLAGVLGAASEGFDRLWEAHLLTNFSLPAIGSLAPVTWFGVISAGGVAIGIGAVQVVRRLSTHSDQVVARVLIVAQALRVLSIVALGLTGELAVAILARWSAAGLSSITAPLLDAWLARNTPSAIRATVFSAVSQGDAFGQVLGGPAIGAIGTWFSLRAAMLASAVLLLPGLVLLRLAGGQSNKNEPVPRIADAASKGA
jgi:DHA3 family tetracycline resistance protein-like MFS transporter